MKCPECGLPVWRMDESRTLVGFGYITDAQGVTHLHDDNCIKRFYACQSGHKWMESLRRSCSVVGCEWKGKLTCFCHPGEKVDQWSI